MLELAQTIVKLTNSTSKVIHLPLPEDDPKQRKPDISQANSVLGWNPTVQLEEGISLTIENFRNRLLTKK
jgi:UDP-glucuronate decarboxylase